MRVKSTIAVAVLSLLMLAGCASSPSPAPVASANEQTDPTVEPTPTPTPTPTRTPTPTPTPTPFDPGPNDIYPVKPTSTDLSCNDAIVKAAAVPGSEVNNDEIYVSLLACHSVDEWGAAIVANPRVFAVTRIPSDEIDFYTMIVCLGAEETPVCVDAATR